MDWFGPTGALLREAGAKPAIPLMVAASLALLAVRSGEIVRSLPAPSWRLLCMYLGIFLCGLLAFVSNLIFGWSRFGEAKDPFNQFIGQAALFVLTPFLIVMHGELFRERQWSSYVLGLLPWAAAIHLFFLALDLAGVLDSGHLPLSLFRNGSEAFKMRVSGMFSEPSYFGTMAALYGVPLVLLGPARSKKLWLMLAVLLFAGALYIGGKTVIPVTVCSLLGYAWCSKTRILRPRNLAIAGLVAVVSSIVVLGKSALNVQDNLSSAMRFGSTLTSINAAASGYGLIGTGFGQFHFMYVKKFMPSFLLYSEEAITQMASSAEHRTSTYNLFTRYLIETGIVGLSLFLASLRELLKMAKNDGSAASILAVVFISASLGFLLTQEPYCYPPLILGAALVLGAHSGLQPEEKEAKA
jgi:hypothetical protein